MLQPRRILSCRAASQQVPKVHAEFAAAIAKGLTVHIFCQSCDSFSSRCDVEGRVKATEDYFKEWAYVEATTQFDLQSKLNFSTHKVLKSVSTEHRKKLLEAIRAAGLASHTADGTTTIVENAMNDMLAELDRHEIVERYKRFVVPLRNQLNIKSMEEWYHVDTKALKGSDIGRQVLSFKDSSLYLAVSSVFPSHKWYPWLFKPLRANNQKVPRGYWKVLENHRLFCDWFMQHYQLNNLEDWYSVTTPQFEEYGNGILNEHNNSIWRILAAAYPEHEWKPWLGSMVPKGMWDDQRQRRRYFDWAMEALALKGMDGWYKVTSSMLYKVRGEYLLKYYFGGSVAKALEDAYPEHEWHGWRFAFTYEKYWTDVSRVNRFFEFHSEGLGVSKLEDWYHVEQKALLDCGAGPIFHTWGSYMSALQVAYPNHQFVEWKFPFISASFWRDQRNTRRALDGLTTHFKLQSVRDLATLPRKDLQQLVGIKFFEVFGRVEDAILFAYPEEGPHTLITPKRVE